MPTGHVFISYAREDTRFADLLQQALESAGISVWRDTADIWPGEDFRAKIRREITTNALVFIACFSRQSLARGVSFQNEELALAIEQVRLRRPDQLWLIPVRFDDCQIPDWDVGGGRTLATIQCADLFGDRAADGMQRLVVTVRRVLNGTTASLPGSRQALQADGDLVRKWHRSPGSSAPFGAVPSNVPGPSAEWSGQDRAMLNRMLSARPMSEVNDPFQLEVHRAIDSDANGLPVLPAYVQREHDRILGAIVARAISGFSGLAVLVGGSSTGKTRACWEALRPLRDCTAEWRLWHPIDPSRPGAALADITGVGPRTVVWLNETQHYLLTLDPAEGEHVAASLRELLRTPERGPVLVLGTMWQAHWDILTAIPEPGEPDPHAQSRQLLEGATIRVAAAFTGADLDAATRQTEGEGDPRLAEALRRADSGRLTQYLAGGPALINRYDNAEPGARAILDAAIAARRLGFGPALPRHLLVRTATDNLSDEQWDLLADDWPERAFAYLTDPRPCRGVRPPLTLIRPRFGASPDSIGQEPLYRLADYLEQHGAKKKSGLAPSAEIRDAADRYGTGASMYCVKCREKRVVPSPEKVLMKNNKPALKARCPVCGTGMYKIGSVQGSDTDHLFGSRMTP